MNVLSLFDGISCGRIALERAGIKVDNYYASEIDKYAIQISKDNWKYVRQVGDVTKISYKNGILSTEKGDIYVGKIDLVIAGSPCQGFSFAGKQLAFDDERSKLYFEFERLLDEVKPKYFLLENVRMKQEYKDVITRRLCVQPIVINSNLVSAQNRQRLYWTNIAGVTQPADLWLQLPGVLQENVDSKYHIKSSRLNWTNILGEFKGRGGCWPAAQRGRYNNQGGTDQFIEVRSDNKANCLTTATKDSLVLLTDGTVRKLTPIECERLQTVPDNYTACATDSQRYKMLGNGWTVDVIAHIFKNINYETFAETTNRQLELI